MYHTLPEKIIEMKQPGVYETEVYLVLAGLDMLQTDQFTKLSQLISVSQIFSPRFCVVKREDKLNFMPFVEFIFHFWLRMILLEMRLYF